MVWIQNIIAAARKNALFDGTPGGGWFFLRHFGTYSPAELFLMLTFSKQKGKSFNNSYSLFFFFFLSPLLLNLYCTICQGHDPGEHT